MAYGDLTEVRDWETGSFSQRKDRYINKGTTNTGSLGLFGLLSLYISTKCKNGLELGCGSGYYSSSILRNPHTLDELSGIDYSEKLCHEFYCNTHQLIPKVTAHVGDILQDHSSMSSKYDWVYSGGLTEHFYGSKFNDVLNAHDFFLKDGGFLSISVPNFQGLNYVWHYLLDRPSLCQHNLMAMRPEPYIEFFEKLGYTTILSDYVDVPHFWGLSSVEMISSPVMKMAYLHVAEHIRLKFNSVLKILFEANSNLLDPMDWAPYYLYIARKKMRN